MNRLEIYIKRQLFWLKDRLHGGALWKEYCDVMRMMLSAEYANQVRTKKLKALLDFAANNTSYYAPYKGQHYLSQYPVVNKTTYRERYSDFVVQDNQIPGQVGNMHIQKTSGSTGTPFEIRQDTRCRTRRLATIKAMNELVGFHSFDTLMHLRAFAHYWGGTECIRYDKSLNIVYADNANLNEDKIRKIVDALIAYNVRFVRGYVTTLDLITQYIVDKGIEWPEHPTFIAGGELLPKNLQQRIINQLHCHVVSQYANEENGVFGQSAIDGEPTTIVLNNANTIIEVLKMDADEPAGKDEMGRVVVTDLTDYAFPMIRYDIGDVARIGDVDANGTILSLKNLAGRSQDMILRTDGTKIDLFNSIPKEVYNNPDVKQWQFAQKSANQYTLILCINSGASAKSKSSWEGVKSSLQELLGTDAEIDIQIVDTLPVLNSGKRKVVVNEYVNRN